MGVLLPMIDSLPSGVIYSNHHLFKPSMTKIVSNIKLPQLGHAGTLNANMHITGLVFVALGIQTNARPSNVRKTSSNFSKEFDKFII